MENEKYSPKSIGKALQYLGKDPQTHKHIFCEGATGKTFKRSKNGVYTLLENSGIESKLYEVSK